MPSSMALRTDAEGFGFACTRRGMSGMKPYAAWSGRWVLKNRETYLWVLA